MSEPRGVTFERAGEIIGGDKPLSTRTISAMIKRGDLCAYGKLGGRRVTLRSIHAYMEGEPTPCHENASVAHPAPAMLPKRRTAHGQLISQGDPLDTTSGAVSIPARLPKRGLIRS